MKKVLKWGFCLLLVLAMMFAFAVGCNPANNENGGGEDDVENVEGEEEEEEEEEE